MKISHKNKSDMVRRLRELDSTPDLTLEQRKIRRLQTKLWYITRDNNQYRESANIFERFIKFLISLKPRKKEIVFSKTVHNSQYN